jgi:hypothetical protein
MPTSRARAGEARRTTAEGCRPGGVDVFRLQAPRRILLLAENSWPSAILSLDANNRDISTGSIAEGTRVAEEIRHEQGAASDEKS